MSKQEKGKEEPKQEERIVTRYDRKLQKRKEQEEKEKRQQKIATITGIVVVAALVCLVASFPIRTWLAVNKTFITVDGDNITQVEFDYNYNLAMTNYLNQYGAYMSYFGVDLSKDLSTQMYSDTLSWKDFFEQMAVENIQKNKALLKEAKTAGFTYDTKEDYEEYEASIKSQAADAGSNVKSFLKAQFGSYATAGRLEGFVKEGMLANAYYEQVAEDKAPTDEAIETYYQENKDDYDSIDYRMVTVNAQLPTELADPEAQDTNDSESGDGTADGEEAEAYVPSEAEVEAAMKVAKEEADKAVKTVASDGELNEGARLSSTASTVRDWLFDASRKQGDTAVLEDETNNRYYAVAFEKRYLDETPSADVRVIISETTAASTILDEWMGGEATEQSFIELCAKYSEDNSKDDGGLYEGLMKSGMEEFLSEWIFAEDRAAGDTTAITSEDGVNYVMYYVGENEPEYKLSIKNTLLNTIMTEYMEQITEGIEVTDSKGNLNYLKVQAEEEAKAAESTEGSSESTQESMENSSESTQESTEGASTGTEESGSSEASVESSSSEGQGE